MEGDLGSAYDTYCDRWEMHIGRKRTLVRPSRRWLDEKQS